MYSIGIAIIYLNTEEVVSLLSLRPGMKVLDVGCGIGGSVFYVAEHFGAVVDGVDLSSNMLSYAQHKLDTKYTHLKDRVSELYYPVYIH